MRSLVPAALALLVPAAASAAPDLRTEGARQLERGAFAEARATLERAVEAHPDDLFARANLASARLAAGQAREAAVVFRELITLATPATAAALWLGLGEAHRALEERDAAREALSQARTLAGPDTAIGRAAGARLEALARD